MPEMHELVDKLQEWVEDRDGMSIVPEAWFTYSAHTKQVGIGRFTLWDSETGYSDEHDEDGVSLEGCKKAFLAEVQELCPFLSEMYDQVSRRLRNETSLLVSRSGS